MESSLLKLGRNRIEMVLLFNDFIVELTKGLASSSTLHQVLLRSVASAVIGRGTWTDGNGKLWLRDFVPVEAPTARGRVL